MFPPLAGMTGAYLHTQLFLLRWSLKKFFAQADLEPISTSHIAGMTDVNYCMQLLVKMEF
jgi:hypothetical protein